MWLTTWTIYNVQSYLSIKTTFRIALCYLRKSLYDVLNKQLLLACMGNKSTCLSRLGVSIHRSSLVQVWLFLLYFRVNLFLYDIQLSVPNNMLAVPTMSVFNILRYYHLNILHILLIIQSDALFKDNLHRISMPAFHRV